MYGKTEVVGMTRALEHVSAANVGKCLDPPPSGGTIVLENKSRSHDQSTVAHEAETWANA